MTRRSLLVLLLTLGLLAGVVPGAVALHDAQPLEWRNGDAVGSCPFTSIKSGNYVRSVQTWLWSRLLIAGADRDGIWGPQSERELKNWQSLHGLSVDGCAGYNTFNTAQHGSHRVCKPECYTLPHMSYIGSSTWRWREPQSDAAHYSYYSENFCWFVRINGVYRPIVRSGNSCAVH